MSDSFDTGKFLRTINTQWVGRVLHYRESVDSTNSWAKQDNPGKASHGALYLADKQYKGRGQHNRKWVVEPGQNLTFSLVVSPSRAERLTLLTLACALAMVRLFDQHKAESISPSTIKWPNDVRYNQQKWVGILTETVFSGSKLERVVIGIGVNVNQTQFPSVISDQATSMAKSLDQSFERESLMAEICERIEFQYRRWHQQDPTLISDLNQSLEAVGSWARIEVDGRRLKEAYYIDGVTEHGELQVRDQNDNRQQYSYEQIRIITD